MFHLNCGSMGISGVYISKFCSADDYLFYVILNQSQLFFVCKELRIVDVQVPVIEGAAD